MVEDQPTRQGWQSSIWHPEPNHRCPPGGLGRGGPRPPTFLPVGRSPRGRGTPRPAPGARQVQLLHQPGTHRLQLLDQGVRRSPHRPEPLVPGDRHRLGQWADAAKIPGERSRVERAARGGDVSQDHPPADRHLGHGEGHAAREPSIAGVRGRHSRRADQDPASPAGPPRSGLDALGAVRHPGCERLMKGEALDHLGLTSRPRVACMEISSSRILCEDPELSSATRRYSVMISLRRVA